MKRICIAITMLVSLNLLAQNSGLKNGVHPGLAAISFDDSKFTRPFTVLVIEELDSEKIPWRGSNDWSLQMIGFIEAPVSGEVTFNGESDHYLKLIIDGVTVIESESSENRSGRVKMEKGKRYPVEVFYSHDGGRSFMKFSWSWKGRKERAIPLAALSHSAEQKKKADKIEETSRARIERHYLTVPNPSPEILPSVEAWQRGRETLVGMTFPDVPGFTCDAWCYESEADLADIISLNRGRMKLIHSLRHHPDLYLHTLITPEPGAVSFTAWIEADGKTSSPFPDPVPPPNICWQFKRAAAFASSPEPYPEFVKRCFIFTDQGMTFLDNTDRKKIPVRAADERTNNPPWVQVYMRDDQAIPPYSADAWSGTSDTKFTRDIIGVVSRDGKWLAAVASGGSKCLCQAWHDCVHNNPEWLPVSAPVSETMWHVKIYVMRNDPEALLKEVKKDFPERDYLPHKDADGQEDQPDTGAVFQTRGTVQNIPVFLNQARKRLTYPLSWLSGSETDFIKWRKKAREIVREAWQSLPDAVPFDPLVVDEQDRGDYTAQKIALNITSDSRILAYLLTPKGKGPFPAVLLLHDHSGIFNIGKEKVIRPWGVSGERIKTAEDLIKSSYGNRYIGDELARRGYVCFAIDAFNWGDRGGGGFEGQQAIASNLMHLGMSFAGLIAYEDVRSAEFLAGLPQVDSKRIGAAGLSMGAYRTWQVSAMSDHIRAGAAICWMGTVKGLIFWFNNQSKGHSSYTMLHPGLYNSLDYPDVASIACPKPMLFYNGEKDDLFPFPAVEAAYAKMRKIWDSRGAGDKLVTKIWPVPHEFNGEMQEEAFDWLDRQLGHRSIQSEL